MAHIETKRKDSEIFLVEEGHSTKKTYKIETKQFSACFTKTGLKKTISNDDRSPQKLDNVDKRRGKMTKVEKR